MKFRFLREYISIIIIVSLTIIIAFAYSNFLDIQKRSLIYSKYEEKAKELKVNLSNLIIQKQKSTLAIALSISSNKEIEKDIKENMVLDDYYKDLIKKYNKHTLYKNIWIELLNKKNQVLYRSWDKLRFDKAGDYHKSDKADVCIIVNQFDLLIKAQIPFYQDGVYIGALEVFSHFNSISKRLQKDSVDSVVLVNNTYSKKIKYPFTNTLIDNYYVANLDAKKEMLWYLKKYKIQNYIENGFKIENGYLIVLKELRDVQNNNIATYVMFKKLSDISTTNLDYQIFQWLVIGLIVLVSLMLIFIFLVLMKNVKLKKYYKSIIDSSTNVMIIMNGDEITDVNKLFFTYVNTYSSLSEFKKDYKCICDFFQEGEDYLQKEMGEITWLEYIVLHKDSYHKVKISFPSKLHYFSISASSISNEQNHYVVVFSDITEQENYKREIENLTITDPLTGINNRRYFHRKIESEILRATRYNHPLSLIMLDIDFFKKVNDTYGHDIGDEVLKSYSRLVSNYLRVNDTFCRIGGEEFVIILPHAKLKEAGDIAEKIREKVEDSKLVTPITMSFGVVEYKNDETSDEFYKRVDNALYEAKESGRNRVVAKK